MRVCFVLFLGESKRARLHAGARGGRFGLAAEPVVQVKRHRLVEVPEVDHPRLLHSGAGG